MIYDCVTIMKKVDEIVVLYLPPFPSHPAVGQEWEGDKDILIIRINNSSYRGEFFRPTCVPNWGPSTLFC